MDTRGLIVAAVAVTCLTLGACGDDEGSGGGVSTTGTRVERSTTASSETEATDRPDRTTAPEEPDGGTATTETPATDPPATDPPPTDAPATTERPTTEVPTTETPTTATQATEPPTTVAATESPATDPQAATDDSSPWWPWLLAGLAIIGLIAFGASRRSRQGDAWKQQTAAALDEATRLATHLAAVAPDGAAMVAAQDAGQLAALAATLSAREAETTDPARRRAVASVRDQVRALHSVVDGIAMGAGAATPTAVGYLREQAMALHGASARARAELFPVPQGSGATTA